MMSTVRVGIARAPGSRNALALALALSSACTVRQQVVEVPDPLPSWEEGSAKASILSFVERITTPGNADFVPVSERIATFDNDGTLWVEKPLPTEVYFVLSRVKALVMEDPALASRQPFKAALEGDVSYFHEAGGPAIAELLSATHTGMSQEEFGSEAREFLGSTLHPTLNRSFTALVYQPMLELIDYLRAHEFQIWISSGGTLDFIRAFAPEVYGVPPERTIGSEMERASLRRAEGLAVYRLAAMEHVNDKEGKPVGIDRQIGRRPAFAAGNILSGGDIAMMEYSKARRGPSLQLLINHDDAEREFSYAEKDGASLTAAHRLGFTVVSMKNDWNRVFAWR